MTSVTVNFPIQWVPKVNAKEGPVFSRLKHLQLEAHPFFRQFNFVGIQVNISKYVRIVNHTSHPHVMEDGTVYNMGMSVTLTGPHYSIIKFPPACNVRPAGRHTLST
jgi:hypothetical protein